MQKSGGVQAPHAVVAVGNNFGFCVKLAGILGQVVERNQGCAFKVDNLIFVGFAYIKQHNLLITVQFILEVARRDFMSIGLKLGTTHCEICTSFSCVSAIHSGHGHMSLSV